MSASPATSSTRTGAVTGVLDNACYLTRDALLLVGRFAELGESVSVSLLWNGRPVPIESRAYTYTQPGWGSEPDDNRTVVMAFPPIGETDIKALGTVVLHSGTTAEISQEELGSRLCDLRTLMRCSFAPLGPDVRNHVVDYLARAAAARPKGRSTRLSVSLHTARQALREHLPAHVNSPDNPRGLTVEHLLAVDESSFYVQGWMRDEESEIVRLTAVSPEGARVELRDRLFLYHRPDVAQFFSTQGSGPSGKSGFIAFIDLETPSLLGSGWVFEMENAEGRSLEVPAPAAVEDVGLVRDMILDDPYRDRLPNDELMAAHVHPALRRIQERVYDRLRIDTVVQLGDAPEAPPVSIVVPIYRRIDHLEMQLAEFADDPELHEADLIYVLDSPDQADALRDIAAQLYPIYNVPFRIAILEQNVGFAGANNAGVSLARAPLLLLLNSDVLPAGPGWLGTMRQFYESQDDIGALGPKLLYEDDSIQHAGMYFHQPPGTDLWLDAHHFKGLHRTFPDANVARPVLAVSGACVMIGRDLYDELGFRGIYVRGDYEDFDLCIRLVEAGKQNWYLPSAELYHLEAQSYGGEIRMPANRYNMWLHTHLWRDRIEELMQRPEFSNAAGSSPGGRE